MAILARHTSFDVPLCFGSRAEGTADYLAQREEVASQAITRVFMDRISEPQRFVLVLVLVLVLVAAFDYDYEYHFIEREHEQEKSLQNLGNDTAASD